MLALQLVRYIWLQTMSKSQCTLHKCKCNLRSYFWLLTGAIVGNLPRKFVFSTYLMNIFIFLFCLPYFKKEIHIWKISSLLEDESTFKYIMMMIVMARVIVNRILMPSPDCCLLATLLNISPQSVLTITKLYYYSSFLSKLATFLTCHLWLDIFYRPQTQIPKHFIKWVSYSLLNVIAQPQPSWE